MKKMIWAFSVAAMLIACNETEVKEVKTAYIDTDKLLDESTEAKDIQAKYKAKSVEMGKDLEVEIARFKAEAAGFPKNAQANGQAWAQQKGAELQRREQQLSYAQNAMLQQLRQESGVEMDTLVSKMKKTIKAYGKEKGYAYIYDGGSVIHAEDGHDLTKEMIKIINDKYKSEGKDTAKSDAKTEDKK
jgi:outer membrane protein